MKTLVVYRSFFGNTQKIAEAIARGLEFGSEVTLRNLEEVVADEFGDYDLLVVGSPTRAFRADPELMALIRQLDRGALRGIEIAAFDTRIQLSTIKSRFFRFVVDKGGYAAPKLLRALKRRGGRAKVNPVGFYVVDTQGPLLENELARAEEWSRNLVEENEEVAV